MRGSFRPFEIELELLRLLWKARVRYLCIGRQACILYGLPLQTVDYDLWVHPEPENIRKLLACAEKVELFPSVPDDIISRRPKFRLENDSLIDVWKVRAFSLSDGKSIDFDSCYERRQVVRDKKRGLSIVIPHIDDLILTKKLAARTKDIEDIKALEVVKGLLAR